MKKTEEILSLFPGHLVEHRTFTYNGKNYFIPYETIYINGELIQGLRKNTDRAELFDSIINPYKDDINSHLDVGSNLGFFVHYFSKHVSFSRGVELEDFYVKTCQTLYPDIQDSFICKDLNDSKLNEIFDSTFDLVTSLSMIEYIDDKEDFVKSLFEITNKICIVEGHSEDIPKGLDIKYEEILKQPNGFLHSQIKLCSHKILN